jgi:CRP-like cAMP-binding protein
MIDVNELKTFSAFRKMSEKNLKKVARLAQGKNYRANETIFNAGDQGDQLYFIVSGTVEIAMPVSESRDRTVAVFEQGEFFGEISFLNQDNHSARARAVEDTQILILNKEAYERIIREDKKEGIEVQQQIFLEVIARLRNMNQRYSLRPFA